MNLMPNSFLATCFLALFCLFSASSQLSLADDSESYHFDRALQYQLEGEPNAAIAEYKSGLRLAPNSVNGHTQLGSLLLNESGDLDAAISEFVTALSIDPGCAYCQSRLDEAVSRLNTPAKDNLARGNDLYRAGQMTRSAAAYRIAAQSDPANAEIRNCLAWTLYRLEKLPDALLEVREALRLKLDEPEYVNTLACIQFDMGDLDSAIASWKKAIAKSKAVNPADLYGLALGFLSKGDNSLAVKNFKEAIKLDPSYADADYLRDKIGMSTRTLASHDKLLQLSQAK